MSSKPSDGAGLPRPHPTVEGPAKLHGQWHNSGGKNGEESGPLHLPTKDCVPKYAYFLEISDLSLGSQTSFSL